MIFKVTIASNILVHTIFVINLKLKKVLYGIMSKLVLSFLSIKF